MFPENNLPQKLPALYYPVSCGFLVTLCRRNYCGEAVYVTIKCDSLVNKAYLLPKFGFIRQMFLSDYKRIIRFEFLIRN